MPLLVSPVERPTPLPPLKTTKVLCSATRNCFFRVLFHRLDASAMVLVWNLGIAALIVVLGTAFGNRMKLLTH